MKFIPQLQEGFTLIPHKSGIPKIAKDNSKGSIAADAFLCACKYIYDIKTGEVMDTYFVIHVMFLTKFTLIDPRYGTTQLHPFINYLISHEYLTCDTVNKKRFYTITQKGEDRIDYLIKNYNFGKNEIDLILLKDKDEPLNPNKADSKYQTNKKIEHYEKTLDYKLDEKATFSYIYVFIFNKTFNTELNIVDSFKDTIKRLGNRILSYYHFFEYFIVKYDVNENSIKEMFIYYVNTYIKYMYAQAKNFESIEYPIKTLSNLKKFIDKKNMGYLFDKKLIDKIKAYVYKYLDIIKTTAREQYMRIVKTIVEGIKVLNFSESEIENIKLAFIEMGIYSIIHRESWSRLSDMIKEFSELKTLFFENNIKIEKFIDDYIKKDFSIAKMLEPIMTTEQKIKYKHLLAADSFGMFDTIKK